PLLHSTGAARTDPGLRHGTGAIDLAPEPGLLDQHESQRRYQGHRTNATGPAPSYLRPQRKPELRLDQMEARPKPPAHLQKRIPMPTVSSRIAEVLARHVDHVFGVMGNGNAYLLDALERDQAATFTAVRHEAGAVVAADAHYRTGGGLAAATTTYGPGFSNTLTSLAESAQARIPLVLITGDAPTTGNRPWDVDQTGLAAAVGAPTFSVGAQNAGAVTA